MNKKVLLNIGESVRLDCNDYGRTFTIMLPESGISRVVLLFALMHIMLMVMD